MSDVVFWGLISTAIIALVISLVVIVVVTRGQRKQAEVEEFATIPLVDVFADAGDRLVRIRATAHAGPSMVVEPISGEPVLWFRLEGRGQPAPVRSEAELLYPFVVRRRGDIVVRDQLGAEARLDPGAGFLVPLDRFGQRDFDIDSESDAAAYDLTAEVRERIRPLIGDDAGRISSLDRLALVPDSDVTITGYVRWTDDRSWTIVGDEATSVVVSTLDDEADAAHPRSSTVEADEPADEPADAGRAGVSRAGIGGALAGGGAAAALGWRRSSRGLSSVRRLARAGGRSTGRRSAGRSPGLSQARGATANVPGLRQARRVTRMGSGARRGGGGGRSMRRLTRGGPAGQVRRLTRKAGGPKLGAGGGTSSIRRLFRRGRSTSRMRLPVRGPRVG